MNEEEEQQQQKESLAKKQGKKLLRDKALKVGKKAAKVAAKLLVKGALAIGKAIIAILSTIGLPYVVGIIGVLFLVFAIYLATSFFFVGAPEELDAEGRAFLAHVTAVADSTVDMSRLEQIPYRVPETLLIAAMQIYDSDSSLTSEEAVTQLGEALKPIFEYEIHEGTIEHKTDYCINNSCGSSTATSTFEEELLVGVSAWDRIMTAEVDSEWSDWSEVSFSHSVDEDGVSSTTVVTTRTELFFTIETVVIDYTLYDRELTNEPFGYQEEGKKTVEAIYELNDGEIYYSEWLVGETAGMDFGQLGDHWFDGTITPGGNVPQEFMSIYLAAEKKYNVPWYYLAAFHYIETKFSTHKPMISSVGAEGHMQFMPCTWVGWSYPGCKGGKGFVNIPDSTKHSLQTIKKYGGLAIDGDGDGKADPWNITDAIFSTASYMNRSGFSTNVDKAIRTYNHSDKYVADIKKKAKEFKDAATYMPNPDSGIGGSSAGFVKPTTGRVSSRFGSRVVQGVKGFHYGQDVANVVNTPVVAVADGVVIQANHTCPQKGSYQSSCGSYWGRHVVVRHNVQGKIYDVVYGHFNQTMVSKGQSVKQGQLLGGMGTSGSSTGVHLHVEVHPGGRQGLRTAVNPVQYIPF